MNNMHESLALVQRRIALIERRGRASGAGGVITLGHDGIDRALGGGLGRGRLHEVLTGADQAASGAGFVAALAYRAGGKVLWLRDTSVEARMGRLYALGLTDIGVDPDRIVFGILPDAAAVLQAAVDALRCPALGAAVVELPGDPRLLDLTASRRLALAAEKSGVLALMLRVGGTSAPSAAQTRWQVEAAPSCSPGANAPGNPAWDLTLLRQRGRASGGQWRVEWNRQQGILRDWHEVAGDAALSGDLAAPSADRPAGSGATLRRAG